jgi:hypothetical protein
MEAVGEGVEAASDMLLIHVMQSKRVAFRIHIQVWPEQVEEVIIITLHELPVPFCRIP